MRLVVGNNGSGGDPLDDLVVGYCRTLFAPIAAAGCQSNASCVALQNGSDTCDLAHGLCFKSTAAPGSACTTETDCPIGGECSIGPRFPGGYCQTFGCSPMATSGVDLCPRQQHLRAARRPRRADLGVLRKLRRRAAAPAAARARATRANR